VLQSEIRCPTQPWKVRGGKSRLQIQTGIHFMKIILAEHLGMCFGVRDAITLALDASRNEKVTILGDLVHNETVLERLKERGIQIAQSTSDIRTQSVIVSAHGASEKRIADVRARGLQVTQATCPLVHSAHRAVTKLAREGFYPIIIGKRDHVEVRGLSEDLEQFDIILEEGDIANLKEQPRYGVAAQTTQPIEKVRRLVELLRQRFPDAEVRFIDTVCQPTKQRQNSAIELAQQCDRVVVIGGAHSNNTMELVKTCERYCARVFHVQTAADLQEGWFESATTVGITAGTSTPDSSIAEVEQWLRQLQNKKERDVCTMPGSND
jgi:4-hydroxy-3-methylbut-2-enyl diphosphate reductase